MFACTEHGDGFCFAVREGQEDYAVYLYDHEINCLVPYASSFVECIRRFAKAT
jgi:hypothetical protein